MEQNEQLPENVAGDASVENEDAEMVPEETAAATDAEN